MAAADPNILYAFLAFLCLLQVTIIGVLIRLGISVGRLESLIPRVERLEEQVSNLRAEVAEVKGMLFALNRSIDFLMRHHHNDAGQVVIVPAEEVAAD